MDMQIRRSVEAQGFEKMTSTVFQRAVGEIRHFICIVKDRHGKPGIYFRVWHPLFGINTDHKGAHRYPTPIELAFWPNGLKEQWNWVDWSQFELAAFEFAHKSFFERFQSLEDFVSRLRGVPMTPYFESVIKGSERWMQIENEFFQKFGAFGREHFLSVIRSALQRFALRNEAKYVQSEHSAVAIKSRGEMLECVRFETDRFGVFFTALTFVWHLCAWKARRELKNEYWSIGGVYHKFGNKLTFMLLDDAAEFGRSGPYPEEFSEFSHVRDKSSFAEHIRAFVPSLSASIEALSS
jgi:hypothetical protein